MNITELEAKNSPTNKEIKSNQNTPRNSNALKHAQYLIEKNLIDVEDFADILEKIKDKKNEKEWNNTYVNILASLCEKGQCYRYMHEKSTDYYSKLSSQFTYFSMIFSFLLSAFTLITTDLEIINLNIITLVSGVGHILIASITGIHKKMNLSEYSESHSKAAKDFDTFCRKIDFQLKLPVEDRNIVPKYVFMCLDKYESIVSSSPKIPVKIIRSFRLWASYNLTIDQPSIVKMFTPLNNNIDKDIIYYEKCDKEKCKKHGLKYMPEFVDNPEINKLMKKQLSFTKNRKNIKRKKSPKIKKLFIDYINLRSETNSNDTDTSNSNDTDTSNSNDTDISNSNDSDNK